MSEESKTNPSGELQFDKAVYRDKASNQSSCMVCKSPLAGIYYQVNQRVACPSCKDEIEKQFSSSNATGRVLKALGFGIPAAIFGAAIYYGIMAFTGYEFGLVAIVIGWLVGAAVRKGSNYRGGLPYQFIAVILTYMSICSTYIPAIIAGFNESYMEESGEPAAQPQSTKLELQGHFGTKLAYAEEPQAPQATVPSANPAPEEEITGLQIFLGFAAIFVLALAAPFLIGVKNIIGLLIIGFGVYQAWAMNKKAVLDIQGPFEVKGPV